MNWKRLLDVRRLGRGNTPDNDPTRSAFQRDYDRILFSTAFRRLHDKTQVFPMPSHDHVHTRLTHSLETASVGRSLGVVCGRDIIRRHDLAGVHPSDFGEIVASACLAHDLGNPPFGHSGEDAIRNWFAEPENQHLLRRLTPAQKADLRGFEGNAQGFRIVSRLELNPEAGGMHLTYAALGAFTKYPRQSVGAGKTGGVSQKKYGFFQSELPLFKSAAGSLGLVRRSPGCWCRHPLAFLTEAADDICYRVLDMEDGHTLRLIDYDTVDELLGTIARAGEGKASKNDGSPAERVGRLRAWAIHQLILEASAVFNKHEAQILAGTFDEALISLIPSGKLISRIEAENRERLYKASAVLEIQAAGFEVLGKMLGRFLPAVLSKKPSAAERNMLELLPCEAKQGGSDYDKILRVLDYITGMTDRYAVNLYRRVHGVSLPGGI